MPDSRFYEALGPVSLAELALATGATLVDPAEGQRMIEGVAPLGRACATDIAFLSDRRYLRDLETTAAGACFISPDHAGRAPKSCAELVAVQPQAAFARAANRLHRVRVNFGEARIHPDAELEADIVLAPGVVIGPGARIGAGTTIGANVVIGPGVCIGRRCRIGPGAVIGFALVGDDVHIYAGAVVGEAGFGVAIGAAGTVDVPQLGRTIVQDRVTVGANSCIDRGAWDDTVVGENTKIDNLVQIAHNVRIGRNCVMAAQTGISGSVTVGDSVMFGGRAGVSDHIEIGAGARVAAAAGVMKNIPAEEIWGGAPARPLRRFMRETAWLAKSAHARGGAGDDD